MRASSFPRPGAGASTPGDFDLVKDRIDIVQLVGERVALRRSGRSFVGLCPFHAEKTPSFHVDPEGLHQLVDPARRYTEHVRLGHGAAIFVLHRLGAPRP